MIYVVKMLELSTAHLTPWICNTWMHNCPWSVYDTAPYGWFMYVPDDYPSAPPELLPIIALAKTLDCAWVKFDCDAPVLDDLPVYDWG